MSARPIAVFDSGLGGLSVVRQLRRLLPGEDIVYFGDTARIPYGTKSRPTVTTFALEAARFLLQFEPKLMVAACNTASAVALDALREELSLPLIGVVEPGARAAVALAAGRPIGVIGTEATIGSGAYIRAIRAEAPGHPVEQRPCPLFVPLVEEGRPNEDPLVQMAAREYLAPLRRSDIGVLILGCTHYPLLRDAIAAALGPTIDIVDSGRETSHAVRAHLQELGGLSERRGPASMRFFVSDNAERFRQVGSRFLDEGLENVEFVEPERYIASHVSVPQSD